MNEFDSFLKDEYMLLQNFYEDFDRRALLIKGWSVTVSISGLALGFDKKQPTIWMMAGLAGILFWFIDAKWRTYQYAYRERIKEIEAHFRGEVDNKAVLPLQIYSSWWNGYQKQSIMHCFCMPLVMLPHVIAVIVSLILYILVYLNIFSPK